MLGAVIAMHRNEHLRLTMFIDKMSPRARGIVHAFALVAMAAFLIGLIGPAGMPASPHAPSSSANCHLPVSAAIMASSSARLARRLSLVAKRSSPSRSPRPSNPMKFDFGCGHRHNS